MINTNFLVRKKILVTGGTGSFGRTIISQFLRLPVREIIVYSRDEEKQWEMRREFPDDRISWVIGDVRDKERLLEWTEGVDILYHAAALKIVPNIEECPLEAVKTNVWGTRYIHQACSQNQVPKAILISTDKAVKPVNTYGMTKALAERVWLDSKSSARTIFSVVRYGNVLGSRGSVIPYFQELIGRGETLPITDKAMSRFLLTLDQAVEIVFQATIEGKGGEIFVPKNPACKIVDLAAALAGSDYPLKVVGIRPGEKLAEVLISEEEVRRCMDRGRHFVIYPHGRHRSSLIDEFTSDNALQLSIPEIHKLLIEAGLKCG